MEPCQFPGWVVLSLVQPVIPWELSLSAPAHCWCWRWWCCWGWWFFGIIQKEGWWGAGWRFNMLLHSTLNWDVLNLRGEWVGQPPETSWEQLANIIVEWMWSGLYICQFWCVVCGRQPSSQGGGLWTQDGQMLRIFSSLSPRYSRLNTMISETWRT